jgi:hypothetical protein
MRREMRPWRSAWVVVAWNTNACNAMVLVNGAEF